MSNKILGSKDLIKKVENASPFDTNIHVNLEALRELPEQFSAVLKSVKFDPKDLDKNFTNISGKWMPKPQLMYDIAEARGVRGSMFYEAKNVMEEVNINPMLCKDYEDQPTMRVMHTGCSSTKQAVVTEDDGTESTGSPCTVIDTFWNECLKVWAAEEEATQGYDPSMVKDGKYTYYKKEYTGKHYIVQNGQYKNAVPVKFDTKWKRKSYYEKQKDLSMNMAQTKSWLKAIREKAGLITAYETKDLTSGELIFSKIVKSSESLKLESLAHLDRISKGIPDQNQSLLFGEQKEQVKNVTEPKKILVPETTDEAISIINDNINNASISDDLKQKSENICKWLQANPNAEQSEHWGDILHTVKLLQESVS
jgi:hypothetical protein